MSVLFEGKESDPSTLEEVVFRSLGAASVCWESMEGTGVFESVRCREIGEEVVAWINANYAKTFHSDYRRDSLPLADKGREGGQSLEEVLEDEANESY